ncbi:hypothetical protein HOLleu_03824 [Holothuria leucospilota]|uniref:Tyr recombinase domain-containing protein n=1 Tax=Holothuria leucospilota TaxID=206669 RepID=A0A9Q1CS44_HOLLE|nr:hypothetical protein HOLleu_03824 [Holothuria leucospilota]
MYEIICKLRKISWTGFERYHCKMDKDSIMAASGTDVKIFSASITRATSTSAALVSKVPLNDIMKSAGWKSEKILAAFYNKPFEKNKFSFAEGALAGSK